MFTKYFFLRYKKLSQLRRANIILKNNKVRGLILPDFTTYYEVTVVKRVVLVREQTDPWNRKQCLEID